MSEKLKPCPFCKSEEIDPEGWMGRDVGDGIRSGPACDNCGASADSVEAWNVRPVEDALRAHAEAMATLGLEVANAWAAHDKMPSMETAKRVQDAEQKFKARHDSYRADFPVQKEGE